MRYINFDNTTGKYEIAILIKDSVLNVARIKEYYTNFLNSRGVDLKDVIIIGLPYEGKDKVSVNFIKEVMAELGPGLTDMGVKNVMVADAKYFVRMAKVAKVSGTYGYRFPCAFEGCDFNITVGINYGAVMYNDSNRKNLEIGLRTITDMHFGVYKEPGANKIKVKRHLDSVSNIRDFLHELLKEPSISCDVETNGLQFWTCGLVSIAFATNDEEGTAFLIKRCKDTLNLLKQFFQEYRGEVYYHNIGFDVKVLVYELFLHPRWHSIEYYGGSRSKAPKLEELYAEQLDAVDIMLRGANCTKILTYLATNNCADNKLDLKSNAQEEYGDWAEDVKDINGLLPDDLLDYNIGDACATLYLRDKYLPKVKADNQFDLYQNMYLSFLRESINAEINGMVMDANKVRENDKKLADVIEEIKDELSEFPVIKTYTHSLKIKQKMFDDEKLKTKERSLNELDHIVFNPGSSKQVAELVYTIWNIPVTQYTDKGSPSTKGKVLKGILNNIAEQYQLEANNNYKRFSVSPKITEQCQILSLIVKLTQYEKVKNTFFKAFLNGRESRCGRYIYLHGNFNPTGTKSGRLSSSDPNLQNIPSGSVLAKLVKECFVAPEGWLFGGADFDSLEDRISALTTKDPNKLKVYTDGYDGHCLRAYGYFSEKMPDIDGDSVESINSIAEKYPKERQDSKGPTFLLTYQGTYLGIMEQFGFSKEKALSLESNYHILYVVSDEWVRDKLIEAAKVGYVEVAFGLKLRTPLIHKYKFLGDKAVLPPAAQKELRTAGNALGQSYCMLNSRAAVEFMQRVRASEFKYDIKLVCMIHDAIYLQFRDDIKVVKFINDNLPDCMAWQELPDIQHDKVKLSGALDIFYPNWGSPVNIPNHSTEAEIQKICRLAVNE